MKKHLPLLSLLLAALVPIPVFAADAPDQSAAIRTPPAAHTPRINGARVYGERPNRPFLFHVPVTGDRPLTIAAQGLPEGLSLDASTGEITGAVAKEGSYDVALTATNALGQDAKPLKIVIGKTVCLTPPMGWNSWNFFHGNIDEAKIRGAADAMVKTGLIDHGWTYINMDDKWEGQRDAEGNIQPSAKFPDMKALSEYIHGKGLKMGIYSSPGPFTCAGAVACYQHEDQDARTYAGWGMDYLKYDWCSYGEIAPVRQGELYAELLPDSAAELRHLSAEFADLLSKHWGHTPGKKPEDQARMDEIKKQLKELESKLDGKQRAEVELKVFQEPYRLMRASLDKVDRDITFSFCQYGMGNVWEWGAETGGNLWRTTGDISASWKSIEGIGFSQNGHEKWAGPGHWNDPDMLEVGNGNLTPDENYTHMTLWCILSAPLLIGCNMPEMTPLTVSLFSNDEVLAVNQDSLGKQGYRVTQDGSKEVWMKPLSGGSLAVAFFNRGESPADVSISWDALKLQGKQNVRDLWRQKDLGAQDSSLTATVAPHGAELFQIHPAE